MSRADVHQGRFELSATERNAPHRRSLAVIAFAHGVSDFYSGIVPLVVYFIVATEHLSPAMQGAFIFLWYLTSSIVQPLFGAFSDRRGQWWFLPAAVATTTVAISFAGLATAPLLLALCIVIGGLGSSIMHPEAGKYAAMVSGARRASGISIFQIGGQIGYALGPAVAAIALARFGGVGLVPLALFGLLASAVLLVQMPRVDRVASGRYTPPSASPSGVAQIDRLGIGLLVSSTAIRHFVTAGFATFLPNVLVGAGYSLSVAGLVVGIFLLVSSIGLYAGGTLADRFGAVRVSVLTLGASVPFLLAFFWLLRGGVPWFVPSVVALSIGSALLAAQNAPGVSLVQSMLPRNLGMALGMMNGVAFGAGSAAVALAGLAVARSGPGPTLAAISLAPLVAAGLFGAVTPRLRKTALA